MAYLPYLYAVSKTTQTIVTADTPQLVNVDTLKLNNLITLDLDTEEITIPKTGIYYLSIECQVSREDTCNAEIPNIRFFIKKNSVNIEDTNSLVNINRHRETKGCYSKDFILSLNENDILTFYISSNLSGISKIESILEVGEPTVPSFSVLMYELPLGESNCL